MHANRFAWPSSKAQNGGMRIPETGTRCRVLWEDIVGGISEPLSRIVPCACWTEGVVVRVEKNFIVLATSQFIEESKDPIGDYTAIPIGCITAVKKRRG